MTMRTSLRGIPLMPYEPCNKTTLTVELTGKWYELFLVTGTIVRAIEYPEDGYCLPAESAYRDHAPNPSVVERFCARNDIYLPEVVREMLIGRWVGEGWEYVEPLDIEENG